MQREFNLHEDVAFKKVLEPRWAGDGGVIGRLGLTCIH